MDVVVSPRPGRLLLAAAAVDDQSVSESVSHGQATDQQLLTS